MDEEELAEWRTIFNLFDVDGDESITGEVKVNHLKIILTYNIVFTIVFPSYSEQDQRKRNGYLINDFVKESLFVTNQPIVQPSQ